MNVDTVNSELVNLLPRSTACARRLSSLNPVAISHDSLRLRPDRPPIFRPRASPQLYQQFRVVSTLAFAPIVPFATTAVCRRRSGAFSLCDTIGLGLSFERAALPLLTPSLPPLRKSPLLALPYPSIASNNQSILQKYHRHSSHLTSPTGSRRKRYTLRPNRT